MINTETSKAGSEPVPDEIPFISRLRLVTKRSRAAPYAAEVLDAYCAGKNRTKNFDRISAVGTAELPVLQVHGAPFFGADYHWVNRVCTPTSGSPCSEERTWASERVLLCIDDKFFSFAKMHTRGHVSALMPKHQYSISLVNSRGRKIKKEV